MKSLIASTALVAVAALAAQSAMAQEKTLYLGSYGGSTETLMKEKIIPDFEKEYGVTVEYVAGNSTENLARLQAQEGNQELDVVLLDDGPMYQARALGFCDELTGISNLDDLYDIAKIGDDAVGMGFVATGFTYNTELFEENGWEPPKTWTDLADEKYEGRLAIPPISNTYGLHTLIMLARANGGGEKDIDAGFDYLADEVADNVLAFEPSPGRMSELFQSEEIVLSVWGSGRAVSLIDTGFPGAFAYPEDGAVALMIAACPVVDSNVPEEAQALIDYILDPENQVYFAETQGWGPVNKNTELDEETASRVPYGPDQIGNLVAIDWDTANQNRHDWTRRWDREIER